MADIGHKETEELIASLEKRLAKEYGQAAAEVHGKLMDYWRRYEIKDEKWREWVASGKRTAEQYAEWQKSQLMMGKRWADMRDTLANDLVKRNEAARKIVDGRMADAYAINFNYATFDIERQARVSTSFTLYNHDSVERILREHPEILPPPGKKVLKEISEGRAVRWEAGKLESVLLQGILQGESIPNLARRVASDLSTRDYKSAVRYARTAMTSAQSAGRYDAYARAQDMGIEVEAEWSAVLDNRTRHDHRVLDGQRRKIGEPFIVGDVQILYPADFGGSDYKVPEDQIWNCRCTILGRVKGWKSNIRRDTSAIGNDYEAWKEGHGKSESVTKQTEISDAMRWAYYRMYRSG